MNKILKFFSLVKYDKSNYFLNFIWAVVKWINPIIHIVFIERIVKALSNQDSILLQKVILYYFIAILLYELLSILTRKIWWVRTIPNSESIIYNMYLKKFVQMDNNEVERIWIWKIIAILENWRFRWAEMLSTSIERWTSLTILLWYSFIVTIKHWIIFTFWFFFLLILSIVVLFYVNKYQHRFRSRRSEVRNNRLRLVTKILMSKNEILQTNRIDSEIVKIEENCDETKKINILMANWRTVQNRFIPFIVWISLFTFIYFYSKIVLSWEMELSEFVWVTSIFLVINSAILNFIGFYVDLTKDFIDIEKMWNFFENTKTIEWYETWKEFKYNKWEIEIKNLTFWYYEWKKIFENFDLKIYGWKITAFVWNSWSWKTTLLKLIAWYVKSISWDIIIDSQKLNETSLKSYYKNIWYLTQEPSVFDGSIIDNLTYAIDRELETWELEKVIKDACLEFINDLPFWLETEIWERWVKLSGWQKQRLAIAKIMLKNPKIILLDEPTSALDSFSEELITKALNNLFKDKTVIIIAHRLQTVKNADTILLFDNWKIVESGNHQNLIEKNWVYKKMLDLQSWF